MNDTAKLVTGLTRAWRDEMSSARNYRALAEREAASKTQRAPGKGAKGTSQIKEGKAAATKAKPAEQAVANSTANSGFQPHTLAACAAA